MSDTSPLALPFPAAPAIPGATPHVARARYKSWDRCDLTFVTLDPGTTVAGVLTQSKCPSPEVEWCRAALTLGSAAALRSRRSRRAPPRISGASPRTCSSPRPA
jgi:glutamate N-acetyltransferase/amino-acid N-acetyltransferase